MSNKRSIKASVTQLGKDAKRPLAIIGGMFLGSQLSRILNRNVSPTVSGIFGLDGNETKKIVTPVLLAASGIVAQQFVKQEIAKDICIGVAISGGAILVNELARKPVISLSGDEETEQVILPGIGNTDLVPLPGMGASEVELPNLDDFGVKGAENKEGEIEGIEGDDYEDAKVVVIDDISGIE
ncbi:MAG TPA: hypothetical protein PLS84_03265 [Salinivirgaceae bacterium]|nr:hypothetical protein [Salinivirgaceae bacterium]